MQDVGVIAAGNMMNAAGGVGQQLQKQLGQTGVPVFNVANACATGATALRTVVMAIKAGEAEIGLAVGVEKLAGAGLLVGGNRKPDDAALDPERSLRRRRRGRRADRHRDHAGVVRPGRRGVRLPPRRHELRTVRQDLREEPRALDAQPAGRLLEAVHARADHGRRDDRVPEHPADVLGQLRRRRRRGPRQRHEAQDPLEGAAAAGREDRGVGAHLGSLHRGLPGAARRQHAHPQRRDRRRTSRPASDRRTSTSSSSTTASPPPSSCTTTT